MMKTRSPRYNLWIALALVVLTAVVYSQVIGNDFINYDDDDYVTENPHVVSGLTAAGVKWAFSEAYSSNWHPLT